MTEAHAPDGTGQHSTTGLVVNRVPVDGMVETGESEVDRSLLTGESLPVFAGPGMMLNAGEANLTGPLTLRVAAAGKDSSLHRMADLVAIAETARNKYTSLADKAAAIYAPVVHLVALAARRGAHHHLSLCAGSRRACGDDGGVRSAVQARDAAQIRNGDGTAGRGRSRGL